MSHEDVGVTLNQYGSVIELTDKVDELAEDPVLRDAAILAGEQAGQTLEHILHGTLCGGTNVYYANGSARNEVNEKISLGFATEDYLQLKSPEGCKNYADFGWAQSILIPSLWKQLI